jgi:hypothetical protein
VDGVRASKLGCLRRCALLSCTGTSAPTTLPSTMPIPPFTHDDVLPPYIGHPGEKSGRSPYDTTTPELVERFATSPERIRILRGFLQYRADLCALGFTGLQWFDGSFVEQIDATRPPNDIDLVTFFVRPAALRDDDALLAAADANPHLFDRNASKARYLCDAFFVEVGPSAGALLSQATYWFGLFSHRRGDLRWKGILALQLMSLAEDAEALTLLDSKVRP